MTNDTQDNEHLHANHALWQLRARVHRDTPMYQGYIKQLREQGSCLNSVEAELLGDISGRKILHLQCHIGTDTLSLASLGAEVTGVDFSEEALEQARTLSADLDLSAKFVHSSVLDPSLNLGQDFDIVFTSYGTICWFKDLEAWADTIARHLKPGGRFVMVDGHPMATVVSENAWRDHQRLELAYPYFPEGGPVRWDDEGTYAGGDHKFPKQHCYEWMHPISEVLTVLIKRKLAIEHFDEHQVCVWAMYPGLKQDDDGYYRMPEGWRDRLPLLFSLVARAGQS